MTVLRIVLTPVLFEEAPAFRGKRGSSGRVAACGDRCPRQKVALIATEPFAIMQIAPVRSAINPETILRIKDDWWDQRLLAVPATKSVLTLFAIIG